MLTRVITFLVFISSPVITILVFSQIIKLFWVFPRFSLVLLDIFVFQFSHLVLVRPHTFLRSASDRLLNFGGLMVLK